MKACPNGKHLIDDDATSCAFCTGRIGTTPGGAPPRVETAIKESTPAVQNGGAPGASGTGRIAKRRTEPAFILNSGSPGEPKFLATPITGWLVAIDGPHKGRAFNLYFGERNTIGGEGCTVHLNKDTGVSSRYIHGQIRYRYLAEYNDIIGYFELSTSSEDAEVFIQARSKSYVADPFVSFDSELESIPRDDQDRTTEYLRHRTKFLMNPLTHEALDVDSSIPYYKWIPLTTGNRVILDWRFDWYIRLSATELRFVPFCDPSFAWKVPGIKAD